MNYFNDIKTLIKERMAQYLSPDSLTTPRPTLPMAMQDHGQSQVLFYQLHVLTLKANRIQNRLLKGSFPQEMRDEIGEIIALMNQYSEAKFGETTVLLKLPAAPIARLLSKTQFLKQMKEELNALAYRLKDLDLSASILQETSVDAYNSSWFSLSPFLKSVLHHGGIWPNQLHTVGQLDIHVDKESGTQNVLSGIGALHELKVVRIKGQLEKERDFNELSLLPKLETLAIEEGPKVMWPGEKLQILPFLSLSKLEISNASTFSSYQMIYALDGVTEVTLRNFSSQNLKDIINIRCFEQFKKINIHLRDDFSLDDSPNPLLRNLIKHYGNYLEINLINTHANNIPVR